MGFYENQLAQKEVTTPQEWEDARRMDKLSTPKHQAVLKFSSMAYFLVGQIASGGLTNAMEDELIDQINREIITYRRDRES